MFLALGRRVAFGAVGFFALLGFASVPLGDKTGWGHVQSILASPAAAHAIAEFRKSAEKSQHQLFEWVTSRLHATTSSEPNTAASATVDTTEGSVPHKNKIQARKGLSPLPRVPSLTE